MEKNTEKTKINEAEDTENFFVNFMNVFQELWHDFFYERLRVFSGGITSPPPSSFFSAKTKEDFDDFCREAVHDKIQSFFHNVAIGPFREYQEMINNFGEAFRNWELSQQDFLLFLNLPLEESWKELEREWGSHAAEQRDKLSPDMIFGLWLEILERRYMALYKSEKFVSAMNLAIQRSADLIKARTALEDGFLKCHNFPTSKEMDELYKDFYFLRKRVESLEKVQERKEKPHDTTDAI